MTIDTQEALRLLDEMHNAACMMGECGDDQHDMPTIATWRNCWKHYQEHDDKLRALLSAKEGEPRDWHAEKDGFTAMGRKPFTYEHQPLNVGAWRLGEACLKAQPGGDLIDRGLSLLQQLQIEGYGVVPVDKLRDAEKEKGK
jgi:hypothetical protein